MAADAAARVLERGEGFDDAGEPSVRAVPDIARTVGDFGQRQLHAFERRVFVVLVEGGLDAGELGFVLNRTRSRAGDRREGLAVSPGEAVR